MADGTTGSREAARRVEVAVPGRAPYPIHIGPGLLSDAGLLARSFPCRQLLVVTDENVAGQYLQSLLDSLELAQVETLVLTPGEAHKDLETVATIWDRLADSGFHRDAMVAALGGGVVGDMAGFAAACYQRGIGFVQLPTTLLAQVDASVGGKTAVNHRLGKNLIGAFHQPSAVIADVGTLATLPERELRAGLAEAIKHAILADADFYEWLERELEGLLALDPDLLAEAVSRCCEIKAAVVAADERERGDRALLNLGHTFGHAIEQVAGYGHWLHGEAVATGLCLAADLAHDLGELGSDAAARIRALVQRAGLPTDPAGMDPDAIIATMGMDKKATRAGLRLILPVRIGAAVIADAVPMERIRAVVRRGCGDG